MPWEWLFLGVLLLVAVVILGVVEVGFTMGVEFLSDRADAWMKKKRGTKVGRYMRVFIIALIIALLLYILVTVVKFGISPNDWNLM